MHAITLTPECERLLEGWKEADQNFNFSKFIQGCMTEDESLLTEAQLARKITEAELAQEKATMKLTHLRNVLPIIVEKREAIEEDTAKAEEFKAKRASDIAKKEAFQALSDEEKDAYFDKE